MSVCPHCDYPRKFKLHPAALILVLFGASLGTLFDLDRYWHQTIFPAPVVSAIMGAAAMLILILPLRRCFRCDQTFFVWKKRERLRLKQQS